MRLRNCAAGPLWAQWRRSGQGAPRVRSISNTRPLVAPRHTAAMIGCRLTPSDFVVFCDCSFQIIVFLTGDEADSLQGGEMLFCFGEISPGSRAPPGPVGQENKKPICEQFCTDSLPRALLLAPLRDLCWGAANVYICRVSNAGGRETSASETRQPTSEPSHCRRRSLALPR